MLRMQSVVVDRGTLKDGEQSADSSVLCSKPLHRFLQKQPGTLAVAVVIFGCAELLMGFQLTSQDEMNSTKIYIPFWQGALVHHAQELFLVCGALSVYTERHPSKKMVTVCLALYVVTLLGVLVSAGYRIACLCRLSRFSRWGPRDRLQLYQLLSAVEGVLCTSSLCVLVLLSILGVFARLALKSTHTQVIIRHIPAPKTDTSTD